MPEHTDGAPPSSPDLLGDGDPTAGSVRETIGYLRALSQTHENRLSAHDVWIQTMNVDFSAMKAQQQSYQEENRASTEAVRRLVEALAESISIMANKMTTSQVLDEKITSFFSAQDRRAEAEENARRKFRKQIRSTSRRVLGLFAAAILGIITILTNRLSTKLSETLAPWAIGILILALVVLLFALYYRSGEDEGKP